MSHSLSRPLAIVIVIALAGMLRAADDVIIHDQVYYPSAPVIVEAGNTITTTSSVTINTGAMVLFSAGSKIELNPGFSIADGGMFYGAAGQFLPYSADFESSEGYALGTLQAQQGWGISTGAATVDSSVANTGSAGLKLSVGSLVVQGFQPGSATVNFADLYVKPVAATTTTSTIVETESIAVSFVAGSSTAEVWVRYGGGVNVWIPTGATFAVDSAKRATSWQRITIRSDYTRKTCDLYVNGVLVAYDLAFADASATYFNLLRFRGLSSSVVTTESYVDTIHITTSNPLGTDSDGDGIPDAWETANGTNASSDDRNSAFGSTGRTVIEQYYLSLQPSNADTTPPSAPTAFVATSNSTTSLGFAWSGATDTGSGTPGVAGYYVFRNGTKINSSLLPTMSFVDTGLSAGTSYTYTVKAVDLAGNVSAASSGFTLSTAAASTSGGFEVFTPL